MNIQIQNRSGFGYFFFGAKLACQPGIKRFVLFPLLINIVLMGTGLYYLFSKLSQWISEVMGFLPEFLSWLHYLLWPLAVISILFSFSYFFSAAANIIASPFSGLLAEKVEQLLCNEKVNDDGLFDMLKDIPRILKREWRKLVYYVPKALGLFLLLWIPAIGQVIGPVLWFIFSAWILAIQYCDFAFDNHKIPFETMRDDLKKRQSKAYGFGALVSVFTSIPVLNLFVLPVAVCGATAMWVYEFKALHK